MGSHSCPIPIRQFHSTGGEDASTHTPWTSQNSLPSTPFKGEATAGLVSQSLTWTGSLHMKGMLNYKSTSFPTSLPTAGWLSQVRACQPSLSLKSLLQFIFYHISPMTVLGPSLFRNFTFKFGYCFLEAVAPSVKTSEGRRNWW